MVTIMINWKDKDVSPMEIKNAAYRRCRYPIIKITTADGTEYWLNWGECGYLKLKV